MARTRIIRSRVLPLSPAERLDRYCAGRFTYLSGEQWRDEILAGKVSLDGVPVHDGSIMLHGGEWLAWDAGGIVEPAVDAAVAVLYEDDWVIAVDKPGNLPVHPSGRYFNHTLVSLLAESRGRSVFPVHRIDRETSGVVLLAFDGRTAGRLSGSKQGGEYLALVHGEFPEGERSVGLPLGADAGSAVRKKRRAWPGGTEEARTRFRRVLVAGDVSLVRCFPETGRLHQIRAHLLAIGHPVVGDKLYGRDEGAFLSFIAEGLTPELEQRLLLPRQALHAAALTFRHPRSGRPVVVRAPLPPLFARFIRSRRAACERLPG